MSCNLFALTIFVIDASGPGVSPFERADILLILVFLRPEYSQYQSASFSLTAEFLTAGSP